ncbi:MAG: hypothetical protein Q8Q59_07390 [Luteolibacter sp.]|jgi:hypothetical protein|nr:hypothetical protein [Luteolibacter sp.]
MKISIRFVLPALAVLSLAACSLFDKPDDPAASGEKPATEGPKLVGRIASIPADKRFVLIQGYGSWNIEAGTILTTRGPDERSANLLVTGESLGQFAAADLQSGTAEIGDAVYSRHAPKAPATPVATEPDPELPKNQQESTSGNVQKNN